MYEWAQRRVPDKKSSSHKLILNFKSKMNSSSPSSRGPQPTVEHRKRQRGCPLKSPKSSPTGDTPEGNSARNEKTARVQRIVMYAPSPHGRCSEEPCLGIVALTVEVSPTQDCQGITPWAHQARSGNHRGRGIHRHFHRGVPTSPAALSHRI